MIFISIILLFLIYLICDYYIKNNWYNDIKGPKSVPLIGSLLHIKDDAHLVFQRDSKIYNNGKLAKYWFCDVVTIALFDVDLTREVFIKNHEKINSRLKTPTLNSIGNRFRGIVTADENYWQFHRDILMKSFTGRKIKTLSSSIEKETIEIISYLKFISKSGQLFSTRSNFMNFNSNIIFDYVFSRRIENIYECENDEQLKVLKSIRDLFEFLALFEIKNYTKVLQPFYFIYSKIFGHPSDPLKKIINKYYKEHCETIDIDNPRDVLDSIISEYRKVNGKEEECSVISITNELILAAVETNSATMEWFTLELCNRPEFQLKLYNELASVLKQLPSETKLINLSHRPLTPLFNATIKEVLRLYPPVPFGVSRLVIEEFTIDNGKYTIPKGAQIIQSLYSMFRDEKYWSSPNEFNPERFLNQNNDTQSNNWFPYSIGVRNCVGMGFSQDELYLLLTNLVLNFQILPPFENTKIDDTPIFGFSFRPKEFKVTLKLR
ncbi:hypothetical protein ACTFIR_009572 [Dictyostelium discoideum]